MSVYRLIEKLGRQNGFRRVEVLQWPGQGEPGNLPLTGSLSPESAYQRAVDYLSRVEGSYDILARSFGCYIAVRLAVAKPEALGRVRLWGPPPFWKMWGFWRRDIHEMERQYRERGTIVDRTFFDQLEPIEVHLPKIRKSVVLAGGEHDEHCSPHYLLGLHRLIINGGGVSSCRIVASAGHEVEEATRQQVILKYDRALFGA